MLSWFNSFPEFADITEFNENSAPFRKNSNTGPRISLNNWFSPPSFYLLEKIGHTKEARSSQFLYVNGFIYWSDQSSDSLML